ncbi:MAG: glycosyl hydrolase [Alistipes sp.]
MRISTEFVSAGDGMLTWDVPAGEWAILRTGMASTGVTNSPAAPEATGLEIDKMNREHVRTVSTLLSVRLSGFRRPTAGRSSGGAG